MALIDGRAATPEVMASLADHKQATTEREQHRDERRPQYSTV